MIIVGTVIALAIFFAVGWAVSAEMFQHRAWRRRVREGDVAMVAALIEEALSTWRTTRPPRGTPANLWAGVQRAQLLTLTADGATLSTSADAEFQTENGQRVQVTSALEEAIHLAARLADMMLYDVPNLSLHSVRVDVYSTFAEPDGAPVQRPIVTTTAERPIADSLTWEALTPEEILGRFQTRFERLPSGQGAPIELEPLEGEAPRPLPEVAALQQENGAPQHGGA